jgi:hypothetical protein
MRYQNNFGTVIRSDETITHLQRESVYAEGELAFEKGYRRFGNPYSASSSTLEQIWMNGWDHGRRIKKKERLLSPIEERSI